MSSVAPPSPACLVLPLSQPAGTCYKRWRKPKLIWRVRFPSEMKLFFLNCRFLVLCMHTLLSVSTRSCKQWCDCGVSMPCRVMHHLLVILHQNRTNKERKYVQLWWCLQHKPFDRLCVEILHCGYLREHTDVIFKPKGIMWWRRKKKTLTFYLNSSIWTFYLFNCYWVKCCKPSPNRWWGLISTFCFINWISQQWTVFIEKNITKKNENIHINSTPFAFFMNE